VSKIEGGGRGCGSSKDIRSATGHFSLNLSEQSQGFSKGGKILKRYTSSGKKMGTHKDVGASIVEGENYFVLGPKSLLRAVKGSPASPKGPVWGHGPSNLRNCPSDWVIQGVGLEVLALNLEIRRST